MDMFIEFLRFFFLVRAKKDWSSDQCSNDWIVSPCRYIVSSRELSRRRQKQWNYRRLAFFALKSIILSVVEVGLELTQILFEYIEMTFLQNIYIWSLIYFCNAFGLSLIRDNEVCTERNQCLSPIIAVITVSNLFADRSEWLMFEPKWQIQIESVQTRCVCSNSLSSISLPMVHFS